MRASEIQPSKLVIFDIDDTLVHTQTRVHVIRDGRTVRSLNSHDFTHYKLQPGESFDFGDFEDAREFFTNAKPIIPLMNQLKHDIATGNKVVMVTARSDFNDRELFLDTFRKYGVDMSRVHVYRAGNIKQKIQTEEKKKIIIRHLLDQAPYTKAIMYDDAKPNLDSFVELKKEYPNTKFYAWHVSPEGEATEYHRTNEHAVAEGYSDTTFKVDRRKLNVPALIQKGAILVTHPHGEQGWETDNKEDWAFSLLSLYNVLQGGWPSEAKKYLKPASYKKAEQQVNSSAPNLGSDKLVYDGKYNQILWSIKKLGIPDNVAFLDNDNQGVAEGLTPNTIHKLADRKGIKWDDEPSFLKLTKRLTGKDHLDDLDQTQLQTVKQYLEKQEVAEGSNKKEATRRIQKMLNDKYKANLDVDGILGPLTLKSINKFIPNAKIGLADEPNKTTAVQGKKVKDQAVAENFADGKNPQDRGDSARHGIPKHATIAQLEKIRSSKTASPRKKQLAHWQINMRRGKAK